MDLFAARRRLGTAVRMRHINLLVGCKCMLARKISVSNLLGGSEGSVAPLQSVEGRTTDPRLHSPRHLSI